MPGLKRCPKCPTYVEETDAQCPKCGYAFPEPTVPMSSPNRMFPSSTASEQLAAVMGIVALASGALAVAWSLFVLISLLIAILSASAAPPTYPGAADWRALGMIVGVALWGAAWIAVAGPLCAISYFARLARQALERAQV